MTRDETIHRTLTALNTKNFIITSFLDSNTCFDIIAKKDDQIMLIKIYENIDSIRREQGAELKKLSQVINASPVIIGEKTKVFELAGNTVYQRYDIPTITVETFETILENKTPEMRYFKGKQIVDIDFEELKKKRNQMQLSLEKMADKVGVAAETLHRFEKGARASLETAKKIENTLDLKIIKNINVLGRTKQIRNVDEIPEEKLLERLHSLGIKMATFEHAPFDAFAESDKGIFISAGKGKFDIPKKALELKKTTKIIDSESIIVTKEYKYKTLEGIPIIEEAELDTINKFKELKKLIKERGNK